MLYANDFNWVKANALETVLRELTDFKAGKKKKRHRYYVWGRDYSLV